MSASEIAFHRNWFVRAAGSAFTVEESLTSEEAGAMFDEALDLPADQFMRKLLELIRNAEHAPSNRVQSAVSLVTSLAEARHLVGAA